MDRVVQGVDRYTQTLPNAPLPSFCPLCGRPLENWHYVETDPALMHPSLVCYDGKGRFMRWWSERGHAERPTGAHYQFRLPTIAAPTVARFDPQTGALAASPPPVPHPITYKRRVTGENIFWMLILGGPVTLFVIVVVLVMLAPAI